MGYFGYKKILKEKRVFLQKNFKKKVVCIKLKVKICIEKKRTPKIGEKVKNIEEKKKSKICKKTEH